MTLHEAIAAAESLLPGHAAADGELDRRWQSIIAVGDFIEAEPEAVWSFVVRWGSSADQDLRAAISTCLLEHGGFMLESSDNPKILTTPGVLPSSSRPSENHRDKPAQIARRLLRESTAEVENHEN